MKRDQAMGLVCAGGVNRSFLARLPALLARLGPIHCSSFRAARQIANSLRAGYACSHCSALEACPAIWIAVSDTMLERTLRDLVAQTPLHRTMVVLCGCISDSLAAESLHTAGARVASLNPVPDSHEAMLVAEGHPDTLRLLRRLLAADRRKLIELKPGTKPLFFAGVHVAAPLLMPWIAAAIESLRASGFTRAEAAAAGEFLSVHALRKYIRAGSKAWTRQTAASLRRALEHDLHAVRSCNPRLAKLYEQGIRVALESF